MAIKSNAAKREAGKVSANKNTKATVMPSQFTKGDWTAVFKYMEEHGVHPVSFVKSHGVVFTDLTRSALTKVSKPNA